MVNTMENPIQFNIRSPLVEHCELDTEIMGIKVARVITSGVTTGELNETLYQLKRQKYRLVYWQSNETGQEEILQSLSYSGKKIGTNVLCVLPVKESSASTETSAVTASIDDISRENLNSLVRSCTRYSHLSEDPNIDKAHVYRLFDCWLQDGLHRSNNRKIIVSHLGA